MQPSNPVNLANLQDIFNKNDADQDGQVVDSEIQQIFNEIGYSDIYIGSIRKVIRLLNLNNGQCNTLSLPRVQQFADAMVNRGKFQIWKMKYKVQQELKEIQNDLYRVDPNEAAPGAGPGDAPVSNKFKGPESQSGQISINVGNENNFNQHFLFKLQKQTGKQIKPFIKITIQRPSNQQAKKVQTIFKKIYNIVIEIIKAEEEQIIAEILSVSFITSVQGNIFNLFITTNNKHIIDFVETIADFFDMAIKQPINGKIESQYHFNFDFEKFLAEPGYNFYDMMVRNSKFSLKWNVWELLKNLRTIALKIQDFEDLRHDPTDPFLLMCITLLHCQKLSGNIQLENTSTQNQQTESKKQLANFIKELRQQLQNLQNDSQLGLMELMEQLDGKISIQVGIKDWKLNIEAKLNNLYKIFTKDMQGY